MNPATGYAATISSVDVVAPALRRFVVSRTKGAFPAISPGSHGVFAFGNGQRTWKNAYSIVNRSEDGRALEIIVRRAEPTRGGSDFLYRHGGPGLNVSVLGISNLFPIVRTGRRHIMISAGIGITPFLSYMTEMRKDGMDYALHHYTRPEEADAFRAMLSPCDPSRVRVHEGRQEAVASLRMLLAREPVASHLYVCGPGGFMEWVRQTAATVGYAATKIHSERFISPAGGRVFEVMLARSGKTITVGADETLLEALENAGIDAPCLCRGGACGMCRVGVINGRPDHRDHVLTGAERDSGDVMLTCVSRSLSPTLTLDL
ncbi:PDR/VanB family oxidoreductase [Komagataeibacter swingsii]|uniref:Ferredoxin n=1 Tax=Komagataeibacter swingsii TaxID=215220 RepID=A0A2V4RLB4_9PROT|nr:PDR/VanB family oxidoreductase [Komagataeibacter swingsii]PYD70586.1 ferredoxin [Komagataeibacter swingsii]GBQ58988.1 ferredoxin [Komagataeibacter swingsii DSM 16373]